MDFIDNIDTVFGSSRRKVCFFPQCPDIFNTIVAGRINFNDIHNRAVINATTDITFSAWITINGRKAVDCFGKYLRAGSLSCSPRTGKKVCMGNPPGFQFILQGDSDLWLSNNIRKFFWAPLPVQNLIQPRHRLSQQKQDRNPLSTVHAAGYADEQTDCIAQGNPLNAARFPA